MVINDEAARLNLTAGLTNLTIRAEPGLDRLVRARFRGDNPRVVVDGNEVTIRSRRKAVDGILEMLGRRRKPEGEITLNASMPWELRLRGGVSNVNADLHDIQLRSVDFAGGVGKLDLNLPQPSGAVPVRIAGGVTKVKLHRPAGVPVTLRARGGVVGLEVDDESFRPIGGVIHWQSPAFDPAQDHYALDISGGVSGLTVDSH